MRINDKWSVSDSELERLQSLSKSELMMLIEGYNFGLGRTTQRSKLINKEIYATITKNTKRQPKKVYKAKTSKRSGSNNSEGSQDN